MGHPHLEHVIDKFEYRFKRDFPHFLRHCDSLVLNGLYPQLHVRNLDVRLFIHFWNYLDDIELYDWKKLDRKGKEEVVEAYTGTLANASLSVQQLFPYVKAPSTVSQ